MVLAPRCCSILWTFTTFSWTGLLRVSSSPVKSDPSMMSSRPLPVVGPQCLCCMWECQGQSQKIPFFCAMIGQRSIQISIQCVYVLYMCVLMHLTFLENDLITIAFVILIHYESYKSNGPYDTNRSCNYKPLRY